MPKKKNPHAVALGRKGGRIGGKATSKAKKRAARKNGAKGGRPPMSLAQGMCSNPIGTLKAVAAATAFKHLGSQGPDLIAKAFGFGSLDDAGVKFAEFKRLKSRRS